MFVREHFYDQMDDLVEHVPLIKLGAVVETKDCIPTIITAESTMGLGALCLYFMGAPFDYSTGH